MLQALFLLRGMKFANCAETLLFIDEIQEVPGAFNMLHYLYEGFPELRVIGMLKSLHAYMNIAPHPYAVRVYADPLSIHPVKTDEDKRDSALT